MLKDLKIFRNLESQISVNILFCGINPEAFEIGTLPGYVRRMSIVYTGIWLNVEYLHLILALTGVCP